MKIAASDSEQAVTMQMVNAAEEQTTRAFGEELPKPFSF